MGIDPLALSIPLEIFSTSPPLYSGAFAATVPSDKFEVRGGKFTGVPLFSAFLVEIASFSVAAGLISAGFAWTYFFPVKDS